MNLDRIEFTYIANAKQHWQNCQNLLAKAIHIREVFYAALELRFCIERLCFEYLVLLTFRKRKLSKSERKRYEPKELFSIIKKESPFLDKAVDFVNESFSVYGRSFKMEFPDMDWLQSTHGRLGNYLHAQKKQMTISERKDFCKFVEQTMSKLKVYIEYRAYPGDLNDQGQMILDKYTTGAITRSQMRKMLELSNIPLHMLDLRK